MQARLDFTYFEYPELAGFERIVLALLRFARGYRNSTGFAPGAFALYFVQRTGHRQRTQLNYGGSAGDKLHYSTTHLLHMCVFTNTGKKSGSSFTAESAVRNFKTPGNLHEKPCSCNTKSAERA